MKKALLKVAVSALSGAFLLSAASCGGDSGRTGNIDEIDPNYQWATEANYNGTDVMDSSEIADYPGEHRISLKAWNTKAKGNFKTYNSSQDVVATEIERITGVSINKKESIDNKGVTADVRYGNLLTSGDLPDIAYGTDWLDTEEVWDLTELIDKYCPTIKARMPEYVWSNENVNGGERGKVYAVPYGLYSVGLESVDPLADVEKSIMFAHLNDCRPYVVVREDILVDAFTDPDLGPVYDVLTTEDIDRIYAEQGGFTEEQLFDIPVTSAEEFREDFLGRIQKKIDKEYEAGNERYIVTAGRPVRTMLTTAGSDMDTWDLMGKLIPYLIGAGANSMNTNMSYWDVSSQKIESMLYQDFYKDEVYEWAKMIKDGTIVSDYGMETISSTLKSELNSGYVAVGYLSSTIPAGNVCTWKDGTQINYRKVYLNIPFDTERFMYCGYGEAVVNSVKFLKSQIKEEELPQLLRWLDFQCSRTADYLYGWGPDGEDALFTTESDGTRRFKDDDLAEQMVFSTAVMGDKVQRYSLANGTVDPANTIFSFYYQGGSIYHPKSVYDLSSLKDLAATYYSSAVVLKEEVKSFVGLKLNPSIHVWTDAHLDGVKAVWAKRPGIEDQLKQLLISGASQSTFDSAWGELQNILTASGWTKSYFNGKVTSAFLKANEPYLDQFYKG